MSKQLKGLGSDLVGSKLPKNAVNNAALSLRVYHVYFVINQLLYIAPMSKGAIYDKAKQLRGRVSEEDAREIARLIFEKDIVSEDRRQALQKIANKYVIHES